MRTKTAMRRQHSELLARAGMRVTHATKLHGTPTPTIPNNGKARQIAVRLLSEFPPTLHRDTSHPAWLGTSASSAATALTSRWLTTSCSKHATDSADLPCLKRIIRIMLTRNRQETTETSTDTKYFAACTVGLGRHVSTNGNSHASRGEQASIMAAAPNKWA